MQLASTLLGTFAAFGLYVQAQSLWYDNGKGFLARRSLDDMDLESRELMVEAFDGQLHERDVEDVLYSRSLDDPAYLFSRDDDAQFQLAKRACPCTFNCKDKDDCKKKDKKCDDCHAKEKAKKKAGKR